MITLFLGSLTAMLVCFALALLLAVAQHRKGAIRLALAGFGFLLCAAAVFILAAWMVAYGS